MGFTARPAVCIVGVLLAAALFLAAPAAAEGEWDAPESCATPVSVEAACRDCVRSLNADARSADASASAGIHGLAVLATRIAVDHAASTEAKIEDLAELEAEGADRARFDHCLEQYGGAADLLRDALDNLQAKVYGLAMQQLMAALGASRSCGAAWRRAPPRAIPVAAHDREYERIAHIAIGFTHAAAK
uniref:Pectinesterase inhibitor domain-containing protein n=1 Tax=Aegilops tauschii TaxID=37682 RepID=M8C7N7_AEGTA